MTDVTELLQRCQGGDGSALSQLLPLVYDELRSRAASQLHRERMDHTLQPTALVHEAWLKLVDQRNQDWNNRQHFLAIAAQAMRRVLVHHAEGAKALKRGGDRAKVTLLDQAGEAQSPSLDVLALDEALQKLAIHDERKAKLVELRFFAGLTAEETSEVLGVTTRTVERDWRMAKAWLRVAMGEGPADGDEAGSAD
jgi:RNA polymerase sigma factor (TIGR02999 family)